MAIQLCPVDTANVHPRNILGSSSSFDRERLSPFGSLSSRCWETVVYITLSSGPAQPGGQPCQKGDAFQLPKDRSRTRATYWVRLIKPWLSALVAPGRLFHYHDEALRACRDALLGRGGQAMNLWERQPSETAKAYAAFLLYRDLPAIDQSVAAAWGRKEGGKQWER